MDRLLSAGGLNYFLAEKSRGCLVFSTLHNEILTFSALFEPTMSKKNVGGEGGYTRARMHSAHLPGHPSPPPHTHTQRTLSPLCSHPSYPTLCYTHFSKTLKYVLFSLTRVLRSLKRTQTFFK